MPGTTLKIGNHISGWSETAQNWGSRGLLAITDQGLISAANFTISILLARWLAPAEYGAYAQALAVMFLAATAYEAIVLEPMSVFAGARYRTQLRTYLGTLLCIHAVVAGAVFVTLGSFSWAAHLFPHSSTLPAALAGVAVASPCIFLLSLARRAFYVELSPASVVAKSALYCTLLMVGVTMVYRLGVLAPWNAFVLMGLASLFTSAVMLHKLKPIVRLKQHRELRVAWSNHWGYGKWALAGVITCWAPSNIFYSFVKDQANAGSLKALLNLSLPAAQAATALSLLFLTYAARVRQERGNTGLVRFITKLTLLYGAGAVVYWALFLPFRGPAVHLLYSGNYGSIVFLTPWLAVDSILQVVINAPRTGLRAMESPKSVMIADSVQTLFTVVLGLPLTWRFGLPGIIFTSIVSHLASLGLCIFMIYRNSRRPQALPVSEGVGGLPLITQQS